MPKIPDLTPPPNNTPEPDQTLPYTPVAPVPDTHSPTASTNRVGAGCNGLKWYVYEYVIGLYKVPSIKWQFTIPLSA